MNTEEEQCNICGRECDGVHSNKIYNKEKEIQKIVILLESYGEKVIDEIITQIYKNRNLCINTENIDYKTLYESMMMEYSKLITQNFELSKELNKYKIRSFKKSPYAEDIECIINESTK